MFLRGNHGWIGVDIGARSVKIAQVSRRGGGLQLDAAAVAPRAEVVPPDDPVALSFSVRREIEWALATLDDLTGRRCAASLSMALCDCAPGKELAAVGDGPNAWCSATWETRDSAKGEDSSYTFSAPLAAAEQVADDLLDAGLSCRTLDAMTHAVARAVAWSQPNQRGKTLGVVDWSYSGALYCSVREGRPVYVRQLKNSALAAVEEELCSELGVSPSDAPPLLLEATNGPAEGRASDLRELITELAEPVVTGLGDELALTLGHLRSHRKMDAPDMILLLGGGGALGAERRLSLRADCPVSVWTVPGLKSPRAAPLCLFGPAIALSALGWESRSLWEGH